MSDCGSFAPATRVGSASSPPPQPASSATEATETAKIASEHHFIRPATDAAFLLGLVHTLFDEKLVTLGAAEGLVTGLDVVESVAREFAPESVADYCGIPADTIRRIAREMAAAPSAACYGRLGTCVQEFGTLASWGCDLVNILTGNLDRAASALEVHLPNALSTPSALKRMHFYGAARFLLETLREKGEATLRLRLPPAFPLFEARGTYDTAALQEWFRKQVESLAAQFDARNGNDYYARWFAGTEKLKAFAISAPLEVEVDY